MYQKDVEGQNGCNVLLHREVLDVNHEGTQTFENGMEEIICGYELCVQRNRLVVEAII